MYDAVADPGGRPPYFWTKMSPTPPPPPPDLKVWIRHCDVLFNCLK